jgi:hypothetical protein
MSLIVRNIGFSNVNTFFCLIHPHLSEQSASPYRLLRLRGIKRTTFQMGQVKIVRHHIILPRFTINRATTSHIGRELKFS